MVLSLPMRSPLDRLRHALSFEIIALVLVVPLGALVFGMPMHDIGVVGIASAMIAAFWNMIYNHIFDLGMNGLFATTEKGFAARVLHAVLFEAGLLVALMPFIAWYLGIALWQAFVMDAAFALFYMVYALAFNWAYDLIFPLPEWKEARSR